MSNLNYSELTNKGKPCHQSDDEKLYNEDKLNIMELASIFKRAPGGITSRLKHLDIINDNENVRGNDEYLSSNLYKEVSEHMKNRFTKKKDLKILLNNDKSYEDNIVKSFKKLNKQMPQLEKLMDNYIILKENNKLKQENNIVSEQFETIIIKDKEYLLIEDKVYNINKTKGTLYGSYNKETNKVTKIK